MSDQNPPHGNNPPGQPPFGNGPQGQPPYGNQGQPPYGAPQGQPPFGNNPGQPPYGAPQGQPQGQPPFGQPIYPQQGYGGPQGPGGPGGPWGRGPGGPQGPGGSGGRKRGLLIGAAVLAVVLVIGGIAGAVALTGGDDDSGSASDDTSETSETSETTDQTEAADPTDATEPVDPAEPAEPTESVDPAGSGESFTAEYNSDVGDVCNGDAMTNSAAYDAAKLKIMVFRNRVDDAEYWSGDSTGYGQTWKVEYEDYEDVNVVACIKVAEQGQGVKCQAKDGKKKIDYTYVPVDYTLTFVKAQTGELIGEGDPLPAESPECPYIAFIDDDGKSYSSPDEEQVLTAINGYEFS